MDGIAVQAALAYAKDMFCKVSEHQKASFILVKWFNQVLHLSVTHMSKVFEDIPEVHEQMEGMTILLESVFENNAYDPRYLNKFIKDYSIEDTAEIMFLDWTTEEGLVAFRDFCSHVVVFKSMGLADGWSNTVEYYHQLCEYVAQGGDEADPEKYANAVEQKPQIETTLRDIRQFVEQLVVLSVTRCFVPDNYSDLAETVIIHLLENVLSDEWKKTVESFNIHEFMHQFRMSVLFALIMQHGETMITKIFEMPGLMEKFMCVGQLLGTQAMGVIQGRKPLDMATMVQSGSEIIHNNRDVKDLIMSVSSSLQAEEVDVQHPSQQIVRWSHMLLENILQAVETPEMEAKLCQQHQAFLTWFEKSDIKTKMDGEVVKYLEQQ
eukprot:GILJ01014370.1.p2 GENE.GILJ01014370.1~~GILJ01014370.1.p2  ORF type:complete len:379 (+),score=65.23 GILJ01014370.1:2123-3259(+)